MRIDIVTIFPEYLEPLRMSLIGRAVSDGTIDLRIHDLRAFTSDRRRTVDDTPYGGGPGMVMKPGPWGRALDSVIASGSDDPPVLIIPAPSGALFTQRAAHELAGRSHLIIACARYEGIDARVARYYAARLPVLELSIGDYVLAGGEAAALVMVEAVGRLLPGVLGNDQSAADDSFSPDRDAALEAPAYTKPARWRGLPVPEVLLSGDHARIAAWRAEQSRARTAELRPDLL